MWCKVMGLGVPEDAVSKRGLTRLLRNVTENCRGRGVVRETQMKDYFLGEEECNIVG